MGDRNDGGPAFPRPAVNDRLGWLGAQQGMTLRDYFAAAYLTGLVSQRSGGKNLTPDERAVLAYIHADAMLAEHDK